MQSDSWKDGNKIMKKSARNYLLKWANSLTNEELEHEYYDSVFSSIGSVSERMYELGYDMVDILEIMDHEHYLSEKASLLEDLCIERGIELWSR